MPKFAIQIKIEEYATRYVECESEELAKAIYDGEVDGQTLSDIEYDYDESCSDEVMLSIRKIES